MVLGDFRSRASCSMKARMSGFSCTRGQQAQLIVCIFVLLLVSGMFPQDTTKVIPLNRQRFLDSHSPIYSRSYLGLESGAATESVVVTRPQDSKAHRIPVSIQRKEDWWKLSQS